MSVASSQPAAAGMPVAPPPPPPAASEACPLCGAPLHPEQQWCLRCGGAARTRLAASPSWKGPVAALATVIALSLGVLAAAVVKLVGDSGSTAPARTATVTVSRATITPTTPSNTQGNLLPGASTTRTSTPGATVTRTTTPGAAAGRTSPGTSTSPAGVRARRRILREKALHKVPQSERETLRALGL